MADESSRERWLPTEVVGQILVWVAFCAVAAAAILATLAAGSNADGRECTRALVDAETVAVHRHSNWIESCRGGRTARLQGTDPNQFKRVADVSTLRL